ncbi:hypothetical protein B0O80DRAFT_462858 [Mortierella sp. GBAus27b]|nr:hypothetical protein B0O80DRAFT_462847 [Mortierella sp. GBAus27b]KAI8348353.1 hypothetical protein B0O80DRAFT_462858 [Mortierella sp. GBAus27b]
MQARRSTYLPVGCCGARCSSRCTVGYLAGACNCSFGLSSLFTVTHRTPVGCCGEDAV